MNYQFSSRRWIVAEHRYP